MSDMRSYRQLTFWQKAMRLAADTYWITRKMPKSEEFKLSGQMIRAAASIPANIAEGNGRGSRRDYTHFISISRGSCAELETFLLLVIDIGLAPAEDCYRLLEQAEEVGRMLNTLRSRLVPSP